MSYSTQFMQCFLKTAHAGALDTEEENILFSRKGHAANGEVLELYLRRDNVKITQAVFKAAGSPALIAAAEFICQEAEGASLESLKQWNEIKLLEALELETVHIAPVALVIKALHDCIG